MKCEYCETELQDRSDGGWPFEQIESTVRHSVDRCRTLMRAQRDNERLVKEARLHRNTSKLCEWCKGQGYLGPQFAGDCGGETCSVCQGKGRVLQ